MAHRRGELLHLLLMGLGQARAKWSNGEHTQSQLSLPGNLSIEERPNLFDPRREGRIGACVLRALRELDDRVGQRGAAKVSPLIIGLRDETYAFALARCYQRQNQQDVSMRHSHLGERYTADINRLSLRRVGGSIKTNTASPKLR